ncbi:MAG: hypothetical protein AB8G05_23140 [Oligoflexales bacterium]
MNLEHLPSENDVARIENLLPQSLICQGVNFEMTKDLSTKELALFLERDLFRLEKNYHEPKPQISLTLIKNKGKLEIRVHVNASKSELFPILGKEIEKIIWSYNHQTLTAIEGKLCLADSRFTYKLNFYLINPPVVCGGLYA